MESPNERGDIDPIIDKIRRGEISVIEAVAEELPDVFRTHVVPKLSLKRYSRPGPSEQVLLRGGVERGRLRIDTKEVFDLAFTADEQHAWFASVHTCWRGPRATIHSDLRRYQTLALCHHMQALRMRCLADRSGL
jgi:hypothetical protein